MFVILFPLSLVGLAVAVLVPEYRDLVLLAGPIAVASLFLLWRGRRKKSLPPKAPSPSDPPKGSVFRKKDQREFVVIDGSNVLFWNNNTPDLATVAAVAKEMAGRGLTAGVIFDANVGYRIGDRYQDDRELAHRLGLPEERVLVVPKGTPADKYILQSARGLKAKIVTNDRYRDWAEEFPEVQDKGFLLRGGVREGAVWVS